MEPKHGTFVVAHADEATAVLRDVEDGQVHTLAENPDLTAGEVVEATVEPAGPVGAAWTAEVDDRRELSVDRSDQPPTRQEFEVAADQPVGDLTRVERAGTGELHVVTAPAGGVEDAVADVLDDETDLVARAGRLGVARVEVRAAEVPAADADGEAHGVVSVRYLP
jgi:hypothetical protein